MPKTQWDDACSNRTLAPRCNPCSPKPSKCVVVCKKPTSVAGLKWDDTTKTMTILGPNLDLTSDESENTVGIHLDSSTSTYNITLPPSQGSESTVLMNDGTGQLTWATPTLGREWIMYSNAHTGTDQALSYAYAATLFTQTGNIRWDNDLNIIFDGSYFSMNADLLTCTVDVPQHLVFRLQMFIVFDVVATTDGSISVVPNINGQPFGLDTVKLITRPESYRVCLKINESLNDVVAGDVITVTLENPDGTVQIAHVNYKAWLQP